MPRPSEPRDRHGRADGRTRALLAFALVSAGAGALLCVPETYPQHWPVQAGPVALQGPAPTANGAAADVHRDRFTAAVENPDPGTAPAMAPSATGTVPAAAIPVSLQLPRLGSDARAQVVPVGTDSDGDLVVPDDPQVVGWWNGGARPADRTGTVVIDGHVDSDRYGIGFFVNLRRLRPGDPVVVEDSAGRVSRWVVTVTREYPASALPQQQVFGRGHEVQLVLITCGGRFDRVAHAYADNVVVYARPVVIADSADR